MLLSLTMTVGPLKTVSTSVLYSIPRSCCTCEPHINSCSYVSPAVVTVGFASESVVVREDNGTVWLLLVKTGENAVSVAVEFTTINGSAKGEQPHSFVAPC